MNHPFYFELQADDVERAKSFYEQVFGWVFTIQSGLPVTYYRIETHGIDGGLLERPVRLPDAPSGTNAAVISMEVGDFDDTAAVILAHGGREALPKFAIPGRCWQGYFLDSEDNTFGIYQADESAA